MKREAEAHHTKAEIAAKKALAALVDDADLCAPRY